MIKHERILFTYPTLEPVWVPVGEAVSWYAKQDKLWDASKVECYDTNRDEVFVSFAKSWVYWDSVANTHRLARVGAGAYGDSHIDLPGGVSDSQIRAMQRKG